jgi:hypothetical protein
MKKQTRDYYLKKSLQELNLCVKSLEKVSLNLKNLQVLMVKNENNEQ